MPIIFGSGNGLLPPLRPTIARTDIFGQLDQKSVKLELNNKTSLNMYWFDWHLND